MKLPHCGSFLTSASASEGAGPHAQDPQSVCFLQKEIVIDIQERPDCFFISAVLTIVEYFTEPVTE